MAVARIALVHYILILEKKYKGICGSGSSPLIFLNIDKGYLHRNLAGDYSVLDAIMLRECHHGLYGVHAVHKSDRVQKIEFPSEGRYS